MSEHELTAVIRLLLEKENEIVQINKKLNSISKLIDQQASDIKGKMQQLSGEVKKISSLSDEVASNAGSISKTNAKIRQLIKFRDKLIERLKSGFWGRLKSFVLSVRR